ncbi:MAG: LuxR C-terminal-related transcriptional regulator [Nibricoccus sp.]
MPSPDSKGASSAARSPDQPPTPPRRIIIVKWDMLTADVLGRLARDAFPSAEVTLCRTGADTLDTLRRRPAALGLFGLTLPDIDGLDLLALVADEHLVARRMIVTGRRDEYSRQALRVARVQGVFDTSVEDSASLVAAIRQVGAGGEYFSAAKDVQVPVQSSKSDVNVHTLTFIEQQVFAIMLEGLDDETIAKRLGMSGQVVGSHRASILRKLHVQTIDQLPAFIRRSSNPWK